MSRYRLKRSGNAQLDAVRCNDGTGTTMLLVWHGHRDFDDCVSAGNEELIGHEKVVEIEHAHGRLLPRFDGRWRMEFVSSQPGPGAFPCTVAQVEATNK